MEPSSATSLAVSLEVSLDHLRRQCGEHPIRLFALFGVLPAGARLKELVLIWGADCAELIDSLLRASLINQSSAAVADPGNKYIWTFPHFSQFARSLMTPEDTISMGTRAAEHYCQLADSFRNSLVVGSTLQFGCTSSLVDTSFNKFEPNYWKVLQMVAEQAAAPSSDSGCHVSSRLAVNLASILFFEGRLADCIRAAEQGVKAAEKFGDQLGLAHSLKMRGVARSLDKSNMSRGNESNAYELAKQDLGEALIKYRSLGVPLGEAVSRLALAEILMHMQQLTGAKTGYERALKVFTQLGSSVREGMDGRLECHRWLATICKKLDRRDDSRGHYEEAAKLQRSRKSSGAIFPHMLKLSLPDPRSQPVSELMRNTLRGPVSKRSQVSPCLELGVLQK